MRATRADADLRRRLDCPHNRGCLITGGLFVIIENACRSCRARYIFCGDWVTRSSLLTISTATASSLHQESCTRSARSSAFRRTSTRASTSSPRLQRSIPYLVPNEAAACNRDTFPRQLSGTSLVASSHDIAWPPGFLPFQINAARGPTTPCLILVAVPGPELGQSVSTICSRRSEFYGIDFFPPTDTILCKRCRWSASAAAAKVASGWNRIFLLAFDGKIWCGSSLRWNDAGTDADAGRCFGTGPQARRRRQARPGGKRPADVALSIAGHA